MVIQLKVVTPKGEDKVIDVCENEDQMKKMTVLHLEKKIIQELSIDSDIRIIFQTELLVESNRVLDCRIKHMSTIHAVLKLPGGV